MTPGSGAMLGPMEKAANTPRNGAGRIRGVLVVEDDPTGAQLLHDHLVALGYSVDCAMDGNRAMVMAGTGEYGAMVLDLRLPEYNGIEVLPMVRKRLLLNPIKVIVVSGDVAATQSHDLYREGIDLCLVKPVDFPRLDAELARIMPVAKAS